MKHVLFTVCTGLLLSAAAYAGTSQKLLFCESSKPDALKYAIETVPGSAADPGKVTYVLKVVESTGRTWSSPVPRPILSNQGNVFLVMSDVGRSGYILVVHTESGTVLIDIQKSGSPYRTDPPVTQDDEYSCTRPTKLS